MFEVNDVPNERESLGRFQFCPDGDRPVVCGIDLLPCAGGRTLAIATELADNPGPSVTNVAEQLASAVCRLFSIHPDRLVWVEHYGYGRAADGGPRPYELVTFARTTPDRTGWAKLVQGGHLDGWPIYFRDPEWRVMTSADWTALGHLTRTSSSFSSTETRLSDTSTTSTPVSSSAPLPVAVGGD